MAAIDHRERVLLNLNEYNVNCMAELELIEYAKDMVQLNLRAHILCEHQRPFVYYTPLTVWEHFKQDWFPAWLIKRFPVKFKKHELTVDLLYPQIKMRLPEKTAGDHVVVAVMGEPVGVYEKAMSQVGQDQVRSPLAGSRTCG